MKRWRTAFFGSALACLITPPIGAQIIDFEDLPPSNDSQLVVGEEYAHMGAHFGASDDGATWGGIEAGDPGGWQLEGSSGSAFLGFDGRSYAISLYFDEPVEAFEIDVARAAGAMPFLFDMFQVTGFLEGKKVESKAVFLGGVNNWKTVALTSMADRVIWFGTGRRGHRFGVDNLRWVGLAPETVAVGIDVRPGSEKNPIPLRSRGVIPVLLYGEENFGVEAIDVDTLAFGPGEAGMAHRNGPHFDDFDGDGLLDMLVHHRVDDTEIAPDDFEACLTGETLDGLLFEGCDLVTPISGR
jgi:hypothetical protein